MRFMGTSIQDIFLYKKPTRMRHQKFAPDRIHHYVPLTLGYCLVLPPFNYNVTDLVSQLRSSSIYTGKMHGWFSFRASPVTHHHHNHLLLLLLLRCFAQFSSVASLVGVFCRSVRIPQDAAAACRVLDRFLNKSNGFGFVLDLYILFFYVKFWIYWID